MKNEYFYGLIDLTIIVFYGDDEPVVTANE